MGEFYVFRVSGVLVFVLIMNLLCSDLIELVEISLYYVKSLEKEMLV